jgi:phospholipid/cholesterol/gamma-HCH transport system substrate-binding protein
METRAPYALIGLFVMTVIAAAFGFVYWLHNGGGLTERTVYRVHFENTVSGLLKGASVLFNGIRVGEVTNLQLDTNNPKVITATIAVDAGTPVRADTMVGLDFQGLTGVPVVTLQGGSAPLNASSQASGEPFALTADPSAGQSMTNSARDTLRRLDTILGDNSKTIHSTMANLSTFTDALARNSGKLDGIVAGLERLTGGGGANAAQVVYDLTAPTQFAAIAGASRGQLIVAEPTALIALETRKFLIRPNPSDESTFAKAEWSDNAPKLLQAKIIQTFENAGLSKTVSRPAEGLVADRQLALDIRKFQISTSPEPLAEIEFAAKIMSDNGRIVEAKVFHATVPAKEMNASSAATALDEAFGKSATELVIWAAGVM